MPPRPAAPRSRGGPARRHDPCFCTIVMEISPPIDLIPPLPQPRSSGPLAHRSDPRETPERGQAPRRSSDGGRSGAAPVSDLASCRSAQALVPRLLIIDDDDDLLQMARAILGADGYLVDTAYAAIDGVHKALRFPPDVILLDVLMRGCDGLEIFDTLRQHERTCNVPVLALSSLAGRDAARLLLDIGFVALIEKPVDWPVLRHELRRHVNGRAI